MSLELNIFFIKLSTAIRLLPCIFVEFERNMKVYHAWYHVFRNIVSGTSLLVKPLIDLSQSPKIMNEVNFLPSHNKFEFDIADFKGEYALYPPIRISTY